MSDRLRLSRLAPALAFLASLALAATAVRAQSISPIDVFTVRNVAVDVTARTAAAARERALKDGQTRALLRLLERLVSRSALDRLPTIDQATANFLVRDFEVANEKTSSVRYLATLTYRFKRSEVRALLRREDIPFAETVSKPVLIVPVLRRDQRATLWQDPNPWRDAWADLQEREGLVPMIVPLGDLNDMADLTVGQAMGGDSARLSAIADRHGAADSMVAVADYGVGLGTNLPALHVTIIRIGVTAQAPLLLTVTAETAEDASGLFRDAALAAAESIEDGWREANLLRFEERRRLLVSVPLRSLADWVSVRRRLGRVAVVAGWSLNSLTRRAAEVELSLIGDESQLDQALAQADLVLEDAPPAPPGLFGPARRQRVLRRTDTANSPP